MVAATRRDGLTLESTLEAMVGKLKSRSQIACSRVCSPRENGVLDDHDACERFLDGRSSFGDAQIGGFVWVQSRGASKRTLSTRSSPSCLSSFLN
jgi:hypothetical protein